MSKKALIIAGTASMISQFNMLNIEVLQNKGYEVEIACDFFNGNNIDENEKRRFKEELTNKSIKIHQIDFTRNVLNIFGHIKALKQIEELRNKQYYDIVHCHMPISAFLTKLAFKKERKKGTKVIYTAHGFHFFKGAPLINWILYYPLEKISSRWLDTLILINKEDYDLAKMKMHTKNIYLTPSIGVDIDRFSKCKINKEEMLSEWNIPKDSFVLLSVGELIYKKNHRMIIEALNKLKNNNIYLLIVGIGNKKEELINYINKCNLESNVKLLGYRKDIEKIYKTSDCLIHIPLREGLGMAPLEAMASNLPLITSNINGIKDYTKENISGCCVNPKSIDEISNAILKMYEDKDFRNTCSKNNIETVKFYGKNNVKKLLEEIY